MRRRFYIVCRAWGNWNGKKNFSEISDSSVGMRLSELQKAVDVWNTVFGIDFFECRRRIQQIAYDNWKDVEGIDGIYTNGKRAYRMISDGDFVLPTDDDDWYSPDVVSKLEKKVTENTDILLWGRVKIRTRVEGVTVNTNRAFTGSTNSYALRYPFEHIIFKNHVEAWKKSRSFNAIKIRKPLSCNNKTILSKTFLNYLVCRGGVLDEPIMFYDILLKCIDYRLDHLDKESRWISKWWDKMVSIYKEVLVS